MTAERGQIMALGWSTWFAIALTIAFIALSLGLWPELQKLFNFG